MLNGSLHFVIDKFIAICNANDVTNAKQADEPPALSCDSVHSICLTTRTFMTGDLSFYHTIIGKENTSTAWCTWCTLSKAEWSEKNHELGDPWTIEELNRVCDDVKCGSLNKNQPQDIKGITMRPLFDAIPINNYVLSVLHIIIGIGNSLVDFLFEWIESRVEKLTNDEVAARNSVLCAMIKHKDAKGIYETWIENDGMAIVQKQLEKMICENSVQIRYINLMLLIIPTCYCKTNIISLFLLLYERFLVQNVSFYHQLREKEFALLLIFYQMKLRI